MDMTGTTDHLGGAGLQPSGQAGWRPAERTRAARGTRARGAAARNGLTRSERASRPDGRLSSALGWFSIGLGLAEVLAPAQVARLIGVRGNGSSRTLLRTMGVREIANGVAILRRPHQPALLWARVGGDVLDLALLGNAMGSPHAQRDRLAGAAAAVTGVTLLDVFAGARLRGANGATATAEEAGTERGIHFAHAVTVNRPAAELYAFWRRFENLPRFMRHLESVQETGGGRSHWVAKAPAGRTVEWDAEIVEERPGELIAWRSLPDADVQNRGTVHFAAAPGGRGTVVRVEMQYSPPVGRLGATVARLFGEEPEMQVRDALRVFKQVMETGEVVLSDGSLHGPKLKQRPAQPARADEVAKAIAGIQVTVDANAHGPADRGER